MSGESPLNEVHRAAGAELAPFLGVVLPAQFQEPVAEDEVARSHVALIDTNFRAVFALTGPDRVRYLNAVTTGNIRDLKAGEGAIGLLLNAQGHILAELETLELEDRLVILGHESVRESTAATLDKYIIMDDATLTDETAQSGTLVIEGPEAPAVLQALTGVDVASMPMRGHVAGNIAASVAESDGRATTAIPCRVIRRSLFGFPGAELLVARGDLEAAWRAAEAVVQAAGGGSVGYRAVNALRIEAGVPWFGVDFGEQQIPHEAGLESTHISFTKGCYTGQEIVERVRSRGHVNRRLAGLRFDTTAPPEAGAILSAGATEVGHVTSAAYSPLLGTAIGFGYVRREYGNAKNILQCGAVQVEVLELPLRAVRPAR